MNFKTKFGDEILDFEFHYFIKMQLMINLNEIRK